MKTSAIVACILLGNVSAQNYRAERVRSPSHMIEERVRRVSEQKELENRYNILKQDPMTKENERFEHEFQNAEKDQHRLHEELHHEKVEFKHSDIRELAHYHRHVWEEEKAEAQADYDRAEIYEFKKQEFKAKYYEARLRVKQQEKHFNRLRDNYHHALHKIKKNLGHMNLPDQFKNIQDELKKCEKENENDCFDQVYYGSTPANHNNIDMLLNHPDGKDFHWVLENNKGKVKEILDNYVKAHREYENFKHHQLKYWEEQRHILWEQRDLLHKKKHLVAKLHKEWEAKYMMEEDDATIQHNDFEEDKARYRALKYKYRWNHKQEKFAERRELYDIRDWERYNREHDLDKKGNEDSKKDYEVADPSEFLF